MQRDHPEVDHFSIPARLKVFYSSSTAFVHDCNLLVSKELRVFLLINLQIHLMAQDGHKTISHSLTSLFFSPWNQVFTL